MGRGTTVDSINVALGADLSDLAKAPAEAERIGKEIAQKLTATVIDTKNLKAVEGELQKLGTRANELRGHLVNVMPDSAEARRFEGELQQIERRMQLLTPIVGKLHKDFEGLNQVKFTGINSGLSGLNNKLTQTDQIYQQHLGRIGDLSNTAGNGLLAVGAAGVAGAVGVIKIAAAYEQTEMAFTSLLGSAAKAQALLKDLKDFAASTPFEFTQITGATRRLLAFGFAVKDIKPMLTSAGDAVSALGGGAEMLDRVIMAMGQMRAKGKVSAEEMMQLAEAGIPAWEMLAAKIGTDIPTAMKKAEAGGINAATGVAALVEGMEKKFGGMMDKQAQTTAGRWSNLVDKLTMLAVQVGETLLPVANKLITFVTDLAGWLQQHVNPQVLVWGTGLALVAGGILKLYPLYAQWKSLQTMLTLAKQADTVITELNTLSQLKNNAARNAGGALGATGGVPGASGTWKNGVWTPPAFSVVGGSTGAVTGLASSIVAALPAIAVTVAAAVAAFAIYKDVDAYREAKQDLADAAANDAKTAEMQKDFTQKTGKTVAEYQADARRHEQEAKAAGYQSYKDLTKLAHDGVSTAITDLQRINPASTTLKAALEKLAAAASVASEAQTKLANSIAAAATSINYGNKDLVLQQWEQGQKGNQLGMSDVAKEQNDALIAYKRAQLAADKKEQDSHDAYTKAVWDEYYAAVKSGRQADYNPMILNRQAEHEGVQHDRISAKMTYQDALDQAVAKDVYKQQQAQAARQAAASEKRLSLAKDMAAIEYNILDLQDQQATATDRVEQARIAGEIRVQQLEESWMNYLGNRRLQWDAYVTAQKTEQEKAAATNLMNLDMLNAQRVQDYQMAGIRRYNTQLTQAEEKGKAVAKEQENLQKSLDQQEINNYYRPQQTNIARLNAVMPLVEQQYGPEVASQLKAKIGGEEANIQYGMDRAKIWQETKAGVADLENKYGKGGVNNQEAYGTGLLKLQIDTDSLLKDAQQKLDTQKILINVQAELDKKAAFKDDIQSYLNTNLALDNKDIRKGIDIGLNTKGSSTDVNTLLGIGDQVMPALMATGAPEISASAAAPMLGASAAGGTVSSTGGRSIIIQMQGNAALFDWMASAADQQLDVRIETEKNAAQMGASSWF